MREFIASLLPQNVLVELPRSANGFFIDPKNDIPALEPWASPFDIRNKHSLSGRQREALCERR